MTTQTVVSSLADEATLDDRSFYVDVASHAPLHSEAPVYSRVQVVPRPGRVHAPLGRRRRGSH